MHKLPFNIETLFEWGRDDRNKFQLRYRDISPERQKKIIELAKNSTGRWQARRQSQEIWEECMNYINPLIIYNDKTWGNFYGTTAIRTGKVREWCQLIDYLTKRRKPTEWEMKQFIYLLPTASRIRDIRTSGLMNTLENQIRENINPTSREMPVQDFTQAFNF